MCKTELKLPDVAASSLSHHNQFMCKIDGIACDLPPVSDRLIILCNLFLKLCEYGETTLFPSSGRLHQFSTAQQNCHRSLWQDIPRSWHFVFLCFQVPCQCQGHSTFSGLKHTEQMLQNYTKVLWMALFSHYHNEINSDDILPFIFLTHLFLVMAQIASGIKACCYQLCSLWHHLAASWWQMLNVSPSHWTILFS